MDAAVAGIVQRTMGNPLRRDETNRTGSVKLVGGAVQFDSLQASCALEQRDGLFSSFMSLTPSPWFSLRPGPRVRHSLFHFIPRLRLPLETPGRQTQPIARRGLVVTLEYEVPRTAYQSARPYGYASSLLVECLVDWWGANRESSDGWILGCDGTSSGDY
ncbi:hypothetical protein BKA56DRAFT_611844 [Ilyonectria sp. MPI-CAGE-AT-0026]|nr:hypothetical protein BKA56DRAFT_611844 [Ilyonectria sp. MPI-CAGE-AT-0026]